MRRGKGLRRKTPLRRTALRPTRTGGSRRPVRAWGPKKDADILFAAAIKRRDGRCVADDGRDCNGGLQCAHIVRRGYLATRWDPRNAVALCAGHHLFFTHRPLEWDDWVVGRIGEVAYQELKGRAKAGPPHPIPYAKIKRMLEAL